MEEADITIAEATATRHGSSDEQLVQAEVSRLTQLKSFGILTDQFFQPVAVNIDTNEYITTIERNNANLRIQIYTLRGEVVFLKNEVKRQARILNEANMCRKPFRHPPSEILHMIFACAMPPWFLLDPSLIPGPTSAFCQTMRTKIAILNVCKTWNKAGARMLFEDVVIRRIQQIHAFVNTLENHSNNLVGGFVKRLTINCYISTSSDLMFSEALQRIFVLCSRMRNLSFTSPSMPVFPNGLLCFKSPITHLVFGDNVDFLTVFATLEQVCDKLISLSLHLPDQHVEAKSLCFDRLKVFSTHSASKRARENLIVIGINWLFSCLESFAYKAYGRYRTIATAAVDPCTLFCEAHGHRLKFLEVSQGTDPDLLQFQRTLDACPLIEHLVIDWRTFVPVIHPNVKWIDVWGPYGSSTEERASFSAMITASAFPALRGLRFLDRTLASLQDLPIMVPPDAVLSPQDVFEYRFPGVHLYYDYGYFYRLEPSHLDDQTTEGQAAYNSDEDDDYDALSDDELVDDGQPEDDLVDEDDKETGVALVSKVSALDSLLEECDILQNKVEFLRGRVSYFQNAIRHEARILDEVNIYRSMFKQPPPKILQLIFTCLTPPWYLLDSSLSPGPTSAWCKTMRTKKAILQVCSTWNKAGTPMFFEDIVLRRPHHIHSFLGTLQQRHDNAGALVKRLTISCHIRSGHESSFIERLKRILTFCPQVSSFTYASPSILSLLKELPIVNPSVTRLEFSSSVNFSIVHATLKLVYHKISSLSLHLPSKYINAEDRIHLSFDKLEIFNCDFAHDGWANLLIIQLLWSFPRLERLSLKVDVRNKVKSELPDMAKDVWRSFCNAHGCSLKYLQIHNAHVESQSFDIQAILDVCPLIEHLVLHWKVLKSFTHPKVVWVDIWVPDKPSREDQESILSHISKDAMPAFRGVRLLHGFFTHMHDIPNMIPPDVVRSPEDKFVYRFPGVYYHHAFGHIYAQELRYINDDDARVYDTDNADDEGYNPESDEDGDDESEESESDSSETDVDTEDQEETVDAMEVDELSE